MNLWQSFEKTSNSKYNSAGISFHYQKGIDVELKYKYISFAKWLRNNYVFPVRINIYILNCEKVQLRNGCMVYGRFRWFPNRSPNICIPSAIDSELLRDYTKKEIYDQILSSLVHELTHYYQWVLKLEQSNATSERQANYYRYQIIDKYNSFNSMNK